MATTTAVTSYRSAGQPDDAVGAVGDVCTDTLNRITWVKQSNNSWVGGGLSIAGPVGPAQLSYNGTPPASFGQNGMGCCDLTGGLTYLKSNNAWAQVGTILGPQGNTGTTLMTSLATSPGNNGAFSSVTLSSTPYVVPYPGSTTAVQFSPPSSSALMGVYAYASAATTLTLYNVTASASVYSVSIAAGASIGNQNFTGTQYPLVAGNVYQWQCTGSASCTFQMVPFYLMPANTNAPAVGMAGPAGFSTAQTFSTTSTRVPIFGTAAGTNSWAYAPPRSGGLYTAQATYFPSSGTSSSASVQLTLNYGSLTGSSTAANSTAFSAVTATGLPQTILTPRLTDQTGTFATGNYFFWTCTGSGSGTLLVNLFTIV